MKKTLLIAAAALAAGVISSQAQVYSLNIVGYVNVPAVPGYTAMANPLSNNGNNSATNLFDTTGSNDGSVILQWTGTKYRSTAFDSTSPTGFSDPNTFAQMAAPILPPGQGFLFNQQNGSNTVTFVGTVATDGPGASTNVVGVSTNILSASTVYVMPSSKLPVGGGISTALGLVNVAGALDGCTVLVPKIIAGVHHGFDVTAFDSASPTGFSDPNTFAQKPEPVITVGHNFLFSNQTGADIQWVQSL